MPGRQPPPAVGRRLAEFSPEVVEIRLQRLRDDQFQPVCEMLENVPSEEMHGMAELFLDEAGAAVAELQGHAEACIAQDRFDLLEQIVNAASEYEDLRGRADRWSTGDGAAFSRPAKGADLAKGRAAEAEAVGVVAEAATVEARAASAIEDMQAGSAECAAGVQAKALELQTDRAASEAREAAEGAEGWAGAQSGAREATADHAQPHREAQGTGADRAPDLGPRQRIVGLSLLARASGRSKEEEIRRAFADMDVRGAGVLSVEDLRSYLCDYLGFGQAEALGFFTRHAHSSDGLVDFECFRRGYAELNPYMLAHRSQEVLVRKPGAVAGQQLNLDSLEDCSVFICDTSAQCFVDYCRSCHILLAPCESSVFVRDCEDCVFWVAAQQLRTSSCKRCTFYLYSKTEPIIEASEDLVIAPWAARYPGGAAQFSRAGFDPSRNLWNAVFDFSGAPGGCHWRIPALGEVLELLVELEGEPPPDGPGPAVTHDLLCREPLASEGSCGMSVAGIPQTRPPLPRPPERAETQTRRFRDAPQGRAAELEAPVAASASSSEREAGDPHGEARAEALAPRTPGQAPPEAQGRAPSPGHAPLGAESLGTAGPGAQPSRELGEARAPSASGSSSREAPGAAPPGPLGPQRAGDAPVVAKRSDVSPIEVAAGRRADGTSDDGAPAQGAVVRHEAEDAGAPWVGGASGAIAGPQPDPSGASDASMPERSRSWAGCGGEAAQPKFPSDTSDVADVGCAVQRLGTKLDGQWIRSTGAAGMQSQHGGVIDAKQFSDKDRPAGDRPSPLIPQGGHASPEVCRSPTPGTASPEAWAAPLATQHVQRHDAGDQELVWQHALEMDTGSAGLRLGGGGLPRWGACDTAAEPARCASEDGASFPMLGIGTEVLSAPLPTMLGEAEIPREDDAPYDSEKEAQRRAVLQIYLDSLKDLCPGPPPAQPANPGAMSHPKRSSDTWRDDGDEDVVSRLAAIEETRLQLLELDAARRRREREEELEARRHVELESVARERRRREEERRSEERQEGEERRLPEQARRRPIDLREEQEAAGRKREAEAAVAAVVVEARRKRMQEEARRQLQERMAKHAMREASFWGVDAQDVSLPKNWRDEYSAKEILARFEQQREAKRRQKAEAKRSRERARQEPRRSEAEAAQAEARGDAPSIDDALLGPCRQRGEATPACEWFPHAGQQECDPTPATWPWLPGVGHHEVGHPRGSRPPMGEPCGTAPPTWPWPASCGVAAQEEQWPSTSLGRELHGRPRPLQAETQHATMRIQCSCSEVLRDVDAFKTMFSRAAAEAAGVPECRIRVRCVRPADSASAPRTGTAEARRPAHARASKPARPRVPKLDLPLGQKRRLVFGGVARRCAPRPGATDPRKGLSVPVARPPTAGFRASPGSAHAQSRRAVSIALRAHTHTPPQSLSAPCAFLRRQGHSKPSEGAGGAVPQHRSSAHASSLRFDATHQATAVYT